MNTKKYLAPFQKEIWEHRRSFIGVFAVLGVLLVSLLLLAIINGDGANMSITFDDENNGEPIGLDTLIKEKLPLMPAGMIYAFILISGAVSMYYCLGALYDDRKDRSILFWKSLPLSETQTVLTKLLTGLFVIPIFALGIGLITSLVMSIVFSLWLPVVSDFGAWEILSNFQFLSATMSGVIFAIVTGIWGIPICAWFLFASAATKRSPLGYATFPPLVIIVTELIIFRDSRLLNMIKAYLPDFDTLDQYDNSMSMQSILTLIESFLSGQAMFIGLIAGIALVVATIWFRNNRYEI